MATVLKKNDPEKARQFFADEMAFTTGPIEVANNLKQATDLAVIDVREDYRKSHVPGAINLRLPRGRLPEHERTETFVEGDL